MKKFTVVICSYNRHFLIDKCLKSVLNNSIIPEKIIIIDQNYNFLTYNKIINLFNIKNYKNYLIIRNLIQRGLTKSKNFSLKHIDTQYVFFIDDDISLKRNFFLDNINLISKQKAHGVCGVISNYEGGPIRNFFYYILNHNIFKDNRYYFINYKKLKIKYPYFNVFQLPGGITCFDSKIFKKVNFDEKFITHNYEDVEFNIRLRKKYMNLRLYINMKTEAVDLLKRKSKENIFMRFYYLRLIYLKNQNSNILFYYYLSFIGLIFSNILNINLNDYFKIYEKLKQADRKIKIF